MPVLYEAVRVAVIGSCSGQQIVNVFNVAPNPGAQNAARHVGEGFAQMFKPVLSNAYAFSHSYAIDMSDPNGETATYSLESYELGALADTPEIGLSAIIRWQDTASGRGMRPGRTYLGPLATSQVTNRGLDVSAGARAAIVQAARDFIGYVAEMSTTLVTVHRPGTPEVTYGLIEDASVGQPAGHLDSRRK